MRARTRRVRYWLIRVVPREVLSSLCRARGFLLKIGTVDKHEGVGKTMKTKLLYHTNSFTYECTATVVAVEGDEIALDATVFYPGGGGQMPDRGIITWDNQEQEGSVIDLNKRDDEVWHTLDRLPPA